MYTRARTHAQAHTYTHTHTDAHTYTHGDCLQNIVIPMSTRAHTDTHTQAYQHMTRLHNHIYTQQTHKCHLFTDLYNWSAEWAF